MQAIAFVFCLFVIYLGFSEIFKAIKGIKTPSRPYPTRQGISYRKVDYSTLLIKDLHAWDSLDFDVVGESNYQENIANLVNDKNLIALLIPEDMNPYDKNAVRVDISGYIVGYLSGEDNEEFRNYIDKLNLSNQITTCKAVVIGGKNTTDLNFSYGIQLR